MPQGSSFPNFMNDKSDSKILKILFSAPGFLSGSIIAQKLKITRAAIRQGIQRLRSLGCKISSRSFHGYRLVSTPDKLLPVFVKLGLKTTIIAREVFFYPKIESTNRQAKAMVSQGVKDGALFVTDYQTHGRGRLKRQWISPPKKNLLFSLLFYPSLPPAKVFQMTLCASLAVCKSLITLYNIKAGIKWPNDVYVNNRKICGILTEASANQKKLKCVVVGIGLNVNSDSSSIPELRKIATSIKKETGKTQRRLSILKQILEEIDSLYKRLLSGEINHIRGEWVSYSIILGKKVNVLIDGFQETGIAETIDEDGALILLVPDGERKKIVAGDVSLRIQ